MPKSKIVFFLHIQADGWGDFYHAKDILYEFIQDQQFKDFASVLIISHEYASDPNIIKAFTDQLKTMNIEFYIYTSDTNDIKKHIAEAKQIIFISSKFGIPNRQALNSLAHPNVQYKFISEHEWKSPEKDSLNFPMGLAPTAFGIKLRQDDKISLRAALSVYQQTDPKFLHSLQLICGAKDLDQIADENLLVPAYFINYMPPIRFMQFVATNNRLSADININFLISGKCKRFFEKDGLAPKIIDIFKSLNIKEINLYIADTNISHKYLCNPHGKRVMRIIIGFYLSDRGYKATYQQARIAGVSGDTSFELATPLCLPYYHSTNAHTKKESNQALAALSTMLNIPDDLRLDYKYLFENIFEWNEGRDPAILEQIRVRFSELDLPRMMEHWPIFATHLVQHYNILPRLPSIIFGNRVANNEQFQSLVPYTSEPEQPTARENKRLKLYKPG